MSGEGPRRLLVRGSPDGVDRTDRTKLSSTLRHCPLCGYDFAETEHEGCPACPVHKYCQVLCCPNCGYEFVEDSWLVSRLRDLKAALGLSRAVEGSEDDDA